MTPEGRWPPGPRLWPGQCGPGAGEAAERARGLRGLWGPGQATHLLGSDPPQSLPHLSGGHATSTHTPSPTPGDTDADPGPAPTPIPQEDSPPGAPGTGPTRCSPRRFVGRSAPPAVVTRAEGRKRSTVLFPSREQGPGHATGAGGNTPSTLVFSHRRFGWVKGVCYFKKLQSPEQAQFLSGCSYQARGTGLLLCWG